MSDSNSPRSLAASHVADRPAVTLLTLGTGLLLWAAAVIALSLNGSLAAIARASAPGYGMLIALGIVIPTLLYFTWGPLNRALNGLSLRGLTLQHVLRIGGGLVFLYYGWLGQLPPVLALLVGLGDIISGLAASILFVTRDPSRRLLRTIHMIGLTDFVIGLSTGMTLGLLGDPRLVPLAELPISLIVLWWVGILATSHIVVLTRLRSAPSR
jgi:hypothetical protein